MTVTQLIQELEKFREQHGDLEVMAHDGLDPSDLCPVKSVNYEPDCAEIYAE